MYFAYVVPLLDKLSTNQLLADQYPMDDHEYRRYSILVAFAMIIGVGVTICGALFSFNAAFVIGMAVIAHLWFAVFSRRPEDHIASILLWGPSAGFLITGNLPPLGLRVLFALPIGAQLGLLVLCGCSELNHRRKKHKNESTA